jgi:hypothetical protein
MNRNLKAARKKHVLNTIEIIKQGDSRLHNYRKARFKKRLPGEPMRRENKFKLS